MKKKILSLFIIGALFAGMGLSAECFAASSHNNHHDYAKNRQHKEFGLHHRQKANEKKQSIKNKKDQRHDKIKKASDISKAFS